MSVKKKRREHLGIRSGGRRQGWRGEGWVGREGRVGRGRERLLKLGV